ncbi:hypothetical protein [Enterococcus casseliflavus]|uniref:hypothetical protein n=1 Tax=Enterococcus casseliflavus TaxID=37734 RepID=UPI001CAA098C|nr:hypothetical protein [Enterococcus casseliflavus]MBZ0323083.1 hypothetical protein [Enterococcus casseliflavus]
MDWYKDSLLCLREAEENIAKIETLEIRSIYDTGLIEQCKPKIKNCLENCRSPLDYAANYLFDTYCRKNYDTHQLKKTRVYYPIYYKNSNFDNGIKTKFNGLSKEKSDILKIIKKTQPFNNHEQWLHYLFSLVNENKHSKLTFSNTEKHINIKKLTLPTGQSFSNITIVNAKSPLIYNGKSYDLINDFPPGDTSDEVSSKNKIYFHDLGLPVVDTLKDIGINVSKTIYKIKELT